LSDKPSRSNPVVYWGIALSAFATPHLIDDFLFEIPAEFGLSVGFSQVLAGMFTMILVGAIVLAARDALCGYWLCLGLGAFLGLAVLLRHIPLILQPGPYWSGLLPEIFILGVLISSAGMLLFSWKAINMIRKGST
jgi:hypothetical protein